MASNDPSSRLSWINQPKSQPGAARPKRVDRIASGRGGRFGGLVAESFASVIATALVCVCPAAAGVIALEIDQLCAVNDGCFPGDDPGFPVTITASGRYRLTSNLTIPDTTVGGILVDADDVEIDLGGFVLGGPVVCSGTPLVCTPSTGFADGIASVLGHVSVQVRDGTVRGMPGEGLSLGPESRITGVRAHSNGASGIAVGQDSTISDSLAFQNGSNGIVAASGVTIVGSVAARNEDDGISSFSSVDPAPGFVVSGSSIYQNQTQGLGPSIVLTLTSSAIYDNGSNGVNLPEAGNVLNGNVITSHTGVGLSGSLSSFTDNTISSNGVDAGASAASSLLGGNSCDGTTTCP